MPSSLHDGAGSEGKDGSCGMIEMLVEVFEGVLETFEDCVVIEAIVVPGESEVLEMSVVSEIEFEVLVTAKVVLGAGGS